MEMSTAAKNSRQSKIEKGNAAGGEVQDTERGMEKKDGSPTQSAEEVLGRSTEDLMRNSREPGDRNKTDEGGIFATDFGYGHCDAESPRPVANTINVTRDQATGGNAWMRTAPVDAIFG